jgi:hypothetical protein
MCAGRNCLSTRTEASDGVSRASHMQKCALDSPKLRCNAATELDQTPPFLSPAREYGPLDSGRSEGGNPASIVAHEAHLSAIQPSGRSFALHTWLLSKEANGQGICLRTGTIARVRFLFTNASAFVIPGSPHPSFLHPTPFHFNSWI